MRLRRLGCVVIAASALAVAGCEGGGVPSVGDAAPAYAAATVDGKPVSLEGLRGRTVLLNVWATWCHPCRAEMPDLERLHQANAARGLHLVGVTVDDAGMTGEIRDFIQEFGVTYDIWHDPSQDVASTFATVGVPTTFLISREGKLLWKHVGPLKSDDPELNRLLDQELGAKS
jgi:thiol-disulfide isomerase/thioredoxin